MPALDVLGRTPLFADLGEEELRVLSRRVSRRTFARDAILYHKGSPAQSLYLVESGQVRIFTVSDIGQEITLELCGPGECFGETGLLDGDLRATGAVAQEKTVVYALSRNDFLQCLDEHPQVARRVITLLAHRLEHSTTYAEKLAFLDVAGRVAAALLELAERHGVEHGSVAIDVRLTQAELASWVSASREMVNRVLAGYRKEGLITTEAHTILILDLPGLKRRAAH